MLQPSQMLIDDFAPVFLVGMDPGFTIQDLMRLAAQICEGGADAEQS